jgi:hypothetical protein
MLSKTNAMAPGWGRDVDDPSTPLDERDDNQNGFEDDAREAGIRPAGTDANGQPFAHDEIAVGEPSPIPLFAEKTATSSIDGARNSSMYYQPMTRLGNLVTNRSGVFAVWITVGYFEVERAPDWNSDENKVQARCGGDINLYNRIYPDGYMLGREVGSDTGDIRRPRGFYIIDRTEEVGFKPGEDLNVDKMIRLRRRIE